jgi:hypothetical protein
MIGDFHQQKVGSKDDFETMLLIRHKLLLHAAMMFQMLPENKETVPGEIGHTLIQKQFFEMLPANVLSRLRTRTIAPQSRRP